MKQGKFAAQKKKIISLFCWLPCLCFLCVWPSNFCICVLRSNGLTQPFTSFLESTNLYHRTEPCVLYVFLFFIIFFWVVIRVICVFGSCMNARMSRACHRRRHLGDNLLCFSFQFNWSVVLLTCSMRGNVANVQKNMKLSVEFQQEDVLFVDIENRYFCFFRLLLSSKLSYYSVFNFWKTKWNERMPRIKL